MTGLHHLWFVWGWPSVKGNGPEDLMATVALGVITAVLWPRARRAVHRFVDRKAEALKTHVGLVHAQSNADLHQKLDHIITHHPDIPPLPKRKATP